MSSRLHGRHLDAIDVRVAALLQVIGDANIVVAVFRHLPAEVAVLAAGIVVAGDERLGLVVLINSEDRIHRRADPAGVAFDFPDLALLGRELEAIGVARLLHAAVQRQRQLGGVAVFNSSFGSVSRMLPSAKRGTERATA